MKKTPLLAPCVWFAASVSVCALAGPPTPPPLQLKPGDTGKVFVGTGMVGFRVLEAAEGGWLHVEFVPGPGVPKAERYWLNVNAALLIEPGPPTP
jgi:hypothetical protein